MRFSFGGINHSTFSFTTRLSYLNDEPLGVVDVEICCANGNISEVNVTNIILVHWSL